MGFIQCNGINLNFQRLGDGPQVVMCHGLVFGTLATWYFTAAATLAARFEVILYDQRGHGKSDLAASGYDIGTLTSDLDCLVRHFQKVGSAEGIALVGHSYGALVALNFALQHPGKVSKLALIDAPLPASRYVYPSMSQVDTREALDRCIPDEIKNKMLQGSRSAIRMQERMEYLFLESSLRQDVRESLDIENAELRKLDIPVLCLYGRNSDCLDAGKRLADVLPNAELRLLECGHFIPLEAPQEMTRQLDEFL